MAGFKCPFCGNVMSVDTNTLMLHGVNFKYSGISRNSEIPFLEIEIFRCPNDDCGEESIFAAGINGYINNSYIPIYPSSTFRRFPDYVPSAIRSDYEEACAIASRSPRAAATLARRCLQGMIHDFWGIYAKNLNAEITQLKGIIPASQWKAIDAVRKIGNISAHMENDVDLIIEVDPDEARKLVLLIERLIEKWYVDRHDEEELYSELTAISQEKDDARLNQVSDH